MGVISLEFTVYCLLFTVDRLGKATAKYVDWPCFLEIMRLELKILGIFN